MDKIVKNSDVIDCFEPFYSFAQHFKAFKIPDQDAVAHNLIRNHHKSTHSKIQTKDHTILNILGVITVFNM